LKNRGIVKRLRPYTSTRTLQQLNSLTKQKVIDAFIANDDALTEDELIKLDKWGKHAIGFLKGEWLRDREDGFIKKRYLPAFRSAINPSLSSYTVNQVYEYTLAQGLSEEDSLRIYKKAVSVYHGETV